MSHKMYGVGPQNSRNQKPSNSNRNHEANHKNHGGGVTIADAALKERAVIVVGEIYN